jgi:hypothetical protein
MKIFGAGVPVGGQAEAGLLSLVVFGLLAFGTPPAKAQPAQPPPRQNANIWNGEAHEPNPGNVEAKERNAGIAPDAQRQQSLTNEVEHLDRKLERQAPAR